MCELHGSNGGVCKSWAELGTPKPRLRRALPFSFSVPRSAGHGAPRKATVNFTSRRMPTPNLYNAMACHCCLKRPGAGKVIPGTTSHGCRVVCAAVSRRKASSTAHAENRRSTASLCGANPCPRWYTLVDVRSESHANPNVPPHARANPCTRDGACAPTCADTRLHTNILSRDSNHVPVWGHASATATVPSNAAAAY